MYTYAQILDNKVHYIMTHEADFGTLYKDYFNKDHVTFVDITSLDPQPEEGWVYDSETGNITEPAEETLTIDEQTTALDETYEPKFEALIEALGLATLANDTDYITELQQEYAGLKAAYQTAKEAIEIGG